MICEAQTHEILEIKVKEWIANHRPDKRIQGKIPKQYKINEVGH